MPDHSCSFFYLSLLLSLSLSLSFSVPLSIICHTDSHSCSTFKLEYIHWQAGRCLDVRVSISLFSPLCFYFIFPCLSLSLSLPLCLSLNLSLSLYLFFFNFGAKQSMIPCSRLNNYWYYPIYKHHFINIKEKKLPLTYFF